MVDKNATAKIGDDRLQGDEDTKSQLSHNSDLWDTSGVRMSALCLNFLQDISDAASQYSSGDRTLERTKKEQPQKKSFADFFRIKRRSKSKKKMKPSETAAPDALDGHKTQNGGQNELVSASIGGKIQKEKGRNNSAERRGTEKEFSFGDENLYAPGNRSLATLPASGRNEGISKRKKGKTLSAEDRGAKSKKIPKEKSNDTPATSEIKEERKSRLTRPLKRLETSIQKIITNVNHKFPATEDLANERSKRENSLEIPIGKLNNREATDRKDTNKLFDKDDFNSGGRDPSFLTGVEEKSAAREEHRPTMDIKNTESAVTPSRESPKTVPRGRARERDTGEKLRRGRSEEVIPTKGQVKRIRRRALSREWIVLKTITTEYTMTFNPTSKSDERTAPSHETALTIRPGSKEDLVNSESGREKEKLVESRRNQEHDKVSQSHRCMNGMNGKNDISDIIDKHDMNDMLPNDANNNDYSEFPFDLSKSTSPVDSQARIELIQGGALAKLIPTPKNSVSRRKSADSNPSLLTQCSPLQENSDTSPQIKPFDVNPIIAPGKELTDSFLLPQTDPYSFHDDELTKESSSLKSFDTANEFNTHPFSKAAELQSAIDPGITSTQSNFHEISSEVKRRQENGERETSEQPPWSQNIDVDSTTAQHIYADKNQREEALDRQQKDLMRFSGSSEPATSETSKPRWTKRKPATRNSAGEKSPPENGGKSPKSHKRSDISGLPHCLNDRDWPEDQIQAKILKNGVHSPRMSKPRWTKRKTTASGSRQQPSTLMPVNSDPYAAQQIHDNGNYVGLSVADRDSIYDGQMVGAAENTDPAANKPRWTKRQPAVRGNSRALVGVNLPMTYEPKGVTSPSSARKGRTPKLSPKQRGTRGEDPDRSYLDSGNGTLNRITPRFSREPRNSSRPDKQRPLITNESSSFTTNDVIPSNTDSSFLDELDSTPEDAARRSNRFGWEDIGDNCDNFLSSNLVIDKDEPMLVDSIDNIRFQDGLRGGNWREEPLEHFDRFSEKSNTTLAIGEDEEDGRPFHWKRSIEGESSSDSDFEYEHCDPDLYQADFDITPTNNETLLYLGAQVDGDDLDDGQATDSETISDRNESRSHDDLENDESSSCFDASQDGIDAAYFADIDANEGSSYLDCAESLSASIRAVNRSAYLSDTDPEFGYNDTAVELASNDREWPPAIGDDMERLGKMASLKTVSVNESPNSSAENNERRRVDTANDEKSMHGTLESSSDVTETYGNGVGVKKAIRDETYSSDDGLVYSSGRHRTTKGLEMITTECQDLDLAAKSENLSHIYEENTDVKPTPDPRRSYSASRVDQTTTEMPRSDTSHENEEFAELGSVKDKASVFSDSETDRYKEQSESAVTVSINPSVDGALAPKEFRELDEPKTASDSNSTESKSETIRLSGRETPTAENRANPEEIKSIERLTQKTAHLAHNPTDNPLKIDSKSSSPSSSLHRAIANRRFQLDDDDRSNNLFLQRRLHIDVPYSDSGYSETEVETLSPCSFRSSISRADTVTEEGGHLESLTDDDAGGSKFGFPLAEDDGLSTTAPDEKNFFMNIPGFDLKNNAWSQDSDDDTLNVSEPHLGGDGVERMPWSRDVLESKIEYATNGLVLDSVSPNMKQENAFLPVSSKRSEFETESQSNESRVSLGSYVSCDSGIGSSVVKADAFQFPESNSTDNETAKLASFHAEGQEKQPLVGQDKGQPGAQIKEFFKGIVLDSCERQLTAAFSLLEDPTDDFSRIQSSEKIENLRKDRFDVNNKGSEILSGILQQKITMKEMDAEINLEPAMRDDVTEITYDSNISSYGKVATSKSERNDVSKSSEQTNTVEFAGNEGHKLIDATSVTKKSNGLSEYTFTVEGNGSEICNRFDKKEKEIEKIVCASNRDEVPSRKIDSEIDQSQTERQDSGINTKNSTGNKFVLKEHNNDNFKGLLEQEAAEIDLAGHQIEVASNLSDLTEDESASKTKTGDDFYRLHEQENAFGSVSHPIDQGQTVAGATEVSGNSQNSHIDEHINDEKEPDIFIRIPRHESEFSKFESPGNHRKTMVDNELEERKGHGQSKISVVKSFQFDEASEVFTDPSSNDISDVLVKNETPVKSTKGIVSETAIMKEKEGPIEGLKYVAHSSIADTTTAVECEIVVEEKSLARDIAGNNAMVDESRQELEALVWHENAEMYSIYRQFTDGNSTDEEWPRPSAWIWNGSRYTTCHRPSHGRGNAVCYPDPQPCRSFSCPIPFARFSLVRDRKLRPRHQSTSALESERQETVRRSFEGENSKRKEPSSASQESRNESSEINCTTIGFEIGKTSIEDQTSVSGGKDSVSVTKSFSKKNSKKQQTFEDSSDQISSLIGKNNRPSHENRMSEKHCLPSSSSTTHNICNENVKIQDSNSNKDSKSETCSALANSKLSSTNEGATEVAYAESVGAAGEKVDDDDRMDTAYPGRIDPAVGPIEDSLDSHLRQRSRPSLDDDLEDATTSDDASTGKANPDDSNSSAPHHTNTSKSSALNYFLVSTAGLLSILFLIYISVRNTETIDINSKNQP